MGKSNMIRKTSNNIKKPKFSRRIRSEVYLLLALYINRSITKKFSIETLLETVDSSVRNPGEVEYNKQNWLRHQKTQVQPLVVNHGKVWKIHWSHLGRNFAT